MKSGRKVFIDDGGTISLFLWIVVGLSCINYVRPEGCKNINLQASSMEIYASGRIQTTVNECRLACKDLGASYSEMYNGYCFCSNTGVNVMGSAKAATYCSVLCQEGMRCGAVKYVYEYNTYPRMEYYLLKQQKSAVAVDSAFVYTISAGQLYFTPVSGTMDLGTSKPGSIITGIGLGNLNYVYKMRGNYTVTIYATDGMGNLRGSSLISVAQTPISSVVLNNPVGILPWNASNLINITVTKGSHIFMRVSFGDNTSTTFQAGETDDYPNFYNKMFAYTSSDAGQYLLPREILMLKPLTIQRNSTLTTFAITPSYFYTYDYFYFQIYRPQCPANYAYCKALDKCISNGLSNREHLCTLSQGGTCDTKNTVFSMGLNKCITKATASGAATDSFNVVDVSDYLLVYQQSKYVTANTKYTLSINFKAVIGDIPAVYAETYVYFLMRQNAANKIFFRKRPIGIYLKNQMHNGGLVFAYNGQEQGPVCNRYMTTAVAKVMCRELGLPTEDPHIITDDRYYAIDSPLSFSITIDYMSCQGNESKLNDCILGPWRVYDPIACNNRYPAAIYCSPVPSIPYVAIQPHQSPNGYKMTGRIFSGNGAIGGTVSMSGFDSNDGNVACRQLGGSYYTYAYYHYGYGATRFMGLTCTGSEPNLENCTKSYPEFTTFDHYYDAGVTCYPPSHNQVEFYFHTKSSATSGLLYMSTYERFGTISMSYFNSVAAKLICQMMGLNGDTTTYDYASSYRDVYYGSTSYPVIAYINCPTLAISIYQCSFTYWPGAGHGSDVYLICGSPDTIYDDNFSSRSVNSYSFPASEAMSTTDWFPDVELEFDPIPLETQLEVTFSHIFETNPCSESPPLCPDALFLNTTLEVWNDISVTPVKLYNQVEFQVIIQNADFLCNDTGYPLEPMDFMVIPHPGTKRIYVWDFGDDKNLTTTDMNVTHIFLFAGVFNVTLTSTNDLSQWIYYKSIVIHEPITGLAISVLPFNYMEPNSTAYLVITLAQGSDVIFTIGTETTFNVTANMSFSLYDSNGFPGLQKPNLLLSHNKPSFQSSLYGGHLSIYGNDGIVETMFITAYAANNFWRVDLGHIYKITHIYLINLKDGNAARLQNLRILVGIDLDSLEQCAFYAGPSSAGDEFKLTCDAVGRHVYLKQEVTNYFHLMEVQVYGYDPTILHYDKTDFFDELYDATSRSLSKKIVLQSQSDYLLSQNKSTYASSVYGYEYPQRGNDARIDTMFHTGYAANNYWRVDLGQVYKITRIYLINRKDGSGERLKSLRVLVGIDLNNLKECAFYPGPSFTGDEFELKCEAVGQHVYLKQEVTNYFHFMEVEVYGYDSITDIKSCEKECILTENCTGVDFQYDNLTCSLVVNSDFIASRHDIFYLPPTQNNTNGTRPGGIFRMRGYEMCSMNLIKKSEGVRIYASSWNENISLTAEAISLSLDGPGWEAQSSSSEYLIVRFIGLMDIVAIRLAPSLDNNLIISSFILAYSRDNVTWSNVVLDSSSLIQGLRSNRTSISIRIPRTRGRFFKIIALSDNPGGRIEFDGCYATSSKTIVPIQFSSKENVFPMVQVTATNAITTMNKSMNVNVEYPIRNASLFYENLYIYGKDIIMDYIIDGGTNFRINTTFYNFTVTFNSINGSDHIGYFNISTDMIPLFGDFDFRVEVTNHATNPIYELAKFSVDYLVDVVNVTYPGGFDVARNLNTTITLYVNRASRFNVTVNYGDGSPVRNTFYYVWYAQVDGTMDLTYNFPFIGEFYVNVTVQNRHNFWNHVQQINCYNPLFPPSIILATTTPNAVTSQLPGLTTFSFQYIGLSSEIPTNVTAMLVYDDGEPQANITIPWDATHLKISHLRNYSIFGDYSVTIFMKNKISSYSQTLSLQVEQAIENLMISRPVYALTVMDTVQLLINKTWGSRINYTITFGDGSSVSVLYNGSEFLPDILHQYTKPERIIASVRAVNLVSNVLASFSEPMPVEYPAKDYILTGFNTQLLTRPNNLTTTPDMKLTICLKSSTFVATMPTDVWFKIDFGAGLPAVNGSAVCVPDSMFPGRQEVTLCNAFPGYQFCTLTPSYRYSVPNHYSVNVKYANFISNGSVTFNHTVFSEVVDLKNVANLNPNYPAADPAQGKYPYFPHEKPIYFNVSTQFGQELLLTYEWNFGDGTSARYTNVPFIMYQFARVGTYTVSVRTFNVEDSDIVYQTVTVLQSVLSLEISSVIPYARLEPYYIDLVINSLGTNACYVLDLSQFGNLLLNQSKVAFGDASMCGSSLSKYYHASISTDILKAYQASLTGGVNEFRVTWETMIVRHSYADITLRGWNLISDVSKTWTMMVTKGYCAYPLIDLATGGGQTTRKRKDIVTVDSNVKLVCHNTSAIIKWSFERYDSDSNVWNDAVPALKQFCTNNQNHCFGIMQTNDIDAAMNGVMRARINQNIYLSKFTIPSYAMQIFNKYKLSLLIVMEDEPTLSVYDEIIYTIEEGKILPCVNGPAESDPISYKWGNNITLDSNCTKDEDIFYDGGEKDELIYEWYCFRGCEKLVFGANYSYHRNATFDISGCVNSIGDTYLGCFTQNISVVDMAYLAPISESVWEDAEDPDGPLLARTAFRKLGWGLPEFNSSAKEIYSMLDPRFTTIRMQTVYMFELQTHQMTLVVRHPRKPPTSVTRVIQLLSGTPPQVTLSCVSNCNRGLMKPNTNRGLIKVDRYSPFKFQLKITGRVPGVIYNFHWCQSDLVHDLLDNFDYGVVAVHLRDEICDLPWANKSSTGTSKSGFSMDTDFPLYPEQNETNPFYFLLRGASWRDEDVANAGKVIVPFTINIPPSVDTLVVQSKPPIGWGLETPFSISCEGAVDEDFPITYSIGYSAKLDTPERPLTKGDCSWIIFNNVVCGIISKLPSGEDVNQNLISICILVTDGAKMSTFHGKFTVTVKTPQVDVESMLSPGGTGAQELDDLSASGSSTTFMAIAGAFLNQMNRPPASAVSSNAENATEETLTTTPEPLSDEEMALQTKKKKTIRENILKSMTGLVGPDFQSADINSVKGVAGVLDQTCSSSQETSQESLDMVSSMGETLLSALSSQADSNVVGAEDVNDASLAVTNVLGNLYDSQQHILSSMIETMSTEAGTTTTMRVDEEPIRDPQMDRVNRENVDKMRNMTRNLMAAVSKKVVVGQKALSLQSPKFGMVVNKLEPDSFAKKPISTKGANGDCSSFKMKTIDQLFEEPNSIDPTVMEKAMSVQSMITTQPSNPILFTNVSRNISSRVVAMEFTNANNEQYNVSADANNATQVEIWVDTSDSNVKPEYAYANAVIPSEPMVYHVANVRPGNALFITLDRFVNSTYYEYNVTLNATHTEQRRGVVIFNNETYTEGEFAFDVFISEGYKPTETNYEYYCYLPSSELQDCIDDDEEEIDLSDMSETSNETSSSNAPTTWASTTASESTTSETSTLSPWVISLCLCNSTTSTCTPISQNQTNTLEAVSCMCNVSNSCYPTSGLPVNGNNENTAEDSGMPTCAQKRGVDPESLRRSRWTCFFDTETLLVTNTSRTFFIGVRAILINLTNETATTTSEPTTTASGVTVTPMPEGQVMDRTRDKSEYVYMTYSALIRSTGCYFLNETSQELEYGGCDVGKCSTIYSTQCICSHLTSFMSSAVVPPIQIDMSDSAWLKLDSNPIAFALCLALVGFWFIVVVWARKRDKDDIIKAGVTPLPCNDPRDKFAYEITVWTGRRRHANTTAHVSLLLLGEEAETEPRVLIDPERPILQRSGVDSFLLTTTHFLGDILNLRVYHDNSGSDPSWYFARMVIEDLQTKKKYYFLANTWLAIDRGEGMVDRVFPVCGKEEINGFENVFWTRTSKNLFDGHLWFSVVTRPPRSKFTRVQRATCCLVIIMWTMMVNLMFYGQAEKTDSPPLFVIGPVKISLQSLFMATISALIVIPINVLIVILFRNRRDRVKVGPSDQSRSPALNLIEERKKELIEDVYRPQTSRVSIGHIDARIISRASVSQQRPMQMHEMTPRHSKDDLETQLRPPAKKKTCRDYIQMALKKIFPLPWWTYIPAYFLSFASVCTCTFLMVEFGGVLGEEKTSEWLASIAISMLQSIFLVQPIKIIAIVMIYALLIKKPEEDVDEVSKELALMGAARMHNEITVNDLTDPVKRREFEKKRKAAYPPPDQNLIAEIQNNRKKNIEMQAIVNDIGFYVIFLLVLMAMAYTNQDWRTYNQNYNVVRTFLDNRYATPTEDASPNVKFEEINSIESIWSFVIHTMIPTLYPVQCYNGDSACDLIEKQWTMDPQLWRLRHAQLRLVKIKPPGACKVPEPFAWLIKQCHEEYSMFDEDTESYLPGWQYTNFTQTNPDLKGPWDFTNAIRLYGTPYGGLFSTYGGGGYVAVLGPTRDESIKVANELLNSSWIDPYARGVFFEFILYNPGSNLYTISTLLVEFSNGGGLFPLPSFNTLRLNRYFGSNSIFYAAIDALSAILILVFVVREIKELKQKGRSYFKEFWNIMDVILIVICFIEIAFFAARILIQQAVSYFLQNYPNRFINFDWVNFWDGGNQALMGCICFIFTTRMLKLLAFNKKISRIAKVLGVAIKPLSMFMIIFIIMFMAFAQLAYLCFSSNVVSFKSFSTTVETLGQMSLNKFDFSNFKIAGKFGLAFFFLYILFVGLILINLFMTIIGEAMYIVKLQEANETNKYDILDFLIQKMKTFMGLNKEQKKLVLAKNTETRFQYISASNTDFEAVMDDLVEKTNTMMDHLNTILSTKQFLDQKDKSKFKKCIS